MKISLRLIAALPEETVQKMTPRKVEIWSEIYENIEKHHQFDLNSCFFVEYLEEEYGVSARSAKRHLRDMRKCGLLDTWVFRRRASGGDLLRRRLMGFPLDPPRWYAYTLKGRTVLTDRQKLALRKRKKAGGRKVPHRLDTAMGHRQH